MLTIDGARGEGGGQILRTALALSLVTGTAFRMERIRAGRRQPGLLRQHLTAVNAAAEIGGAEVEGAALRSGELVFRPGPVRPGAYRFAVGTAGSACLVLQTVLPPLLTAKGASHAGARGRDPQPATRRRSTSSSGRSCRCSGRMGARGAGHARAAAASTRRAAGA